MSNTSYTTRSPLFSIPPYDAALFRTIHEAPTFLSSNENYESIHNILSFVAFFTVLHLLLLLLIKTFTSNKSPMKASYQLTNLLVNLSLGLLGIYYELFSGSQVDHSIANKIMGHPELRYFAIIQIGYQLWGLPIGILFVNETSSMIVHHVAVICVASTSTFLTCGFRYFTPFFYGVIEISSVPLSVMNSFKNNPDWITRYPNLYGKVRLVFGLTFLAVRVVFWTPFYWDVIVLAMMLWRSSVGSTKVILGVFNASSIVLTLLQYFWASKIISAMIKGGPKKSGKKTV